MMALSQTGLEFGLSAGLLIGLGLSGTTFSIVLGVIGRAFPAFLLDRGLAPRDGMIALALIGFFNIIGTYIAGLLGGKFSKKYLLSALYLGRSIVIVVFLLADHAAFRVPLRRGDRRALARNGAAHERPDRADFRHPLHVDARRVRILQPPDRQLPGRVAGGFLFDRTGSYDPVWVISIGLGVMAAIANLPIDEREIHRPAPQRAG